MRAAANHPVPLRSLVGFERISLAAGGAASVRFEVDEAMLHVIDENGQARLYKKGQHKLVASRGHGDEVSFNVSIPSST